MDRIFVVVQMSEHHSSKHFVDGLCRRHLHLISQLLVSLAFSSFLILFSRSELPITSTIKRGLSTKHEATIIVKVERPANLADSLT